MGGYARASNLGRQSHQVIALAATGQLGMAAAGQIRLAVVKHLKLPQLSAQIGGQGTVFSYTQFSAVADGPIWGNGLCRSSPWNPSI
jgi:hypothetical protein